MRQPSRLGITGERLALARVEIQKRSPIFVRNLPGGIPFDQRPKLLIVLPARTPNTLLGYTAGLAVALRAFL